MPQNTLQLFSHVPEQLPPHPQDEPLESPKQPPVQDEHTLQAAVQVPHLPLLSELQLYSQESQQPEPQSPWQALVQLLHFVLQSPSHEPEQVEQPPLIEDLQDPSHPPEQESQPPVQFPEQLEAQPLPQPVLHANVQVAVQSKQAIY